MPLCVVFNSMCTCDTHLNMECLGLVFSETLRMGRCMCITACFRLTEVNGHRLGFSCVLSLFP